ncbi:unnamed protein product [Mytilus edulis]|uniref:Uncharacterized protein n=1 Tax=Mytilus edulis TaxID=6550 RepID=A0A8S3U428_MYTED|nr:unnamed protein product [Mytilus edulis]
MILRTIFLFYWCLSACNGQTGDDVKSLVTQLFTTNTYKKNVRPNADQTQPMQVDLDFYLVGINGIDEITQKLTTTGFLFISWTDEYLTWTPASHGGVEYIYVSQSDIWKPDITLQNGFSKLKELGSSFINVQILPNGEVTWLPTEVFETKCNIDIKYFPFDRQTCEIVFVVWSSSILDVNVTKGSRGILLEALDPNGVWSVVSTTAGDDVLSSESRVVFTITLERSSAYYVMNVIVPVILLGILNVFTFVIPADSGEKMGYSITVFLAFAVFLTIISSELPKTSGSLLGNYLMFQMGMGTFVVAVTALELRIHHRKDKVPNKIQRIFRSKCKTRVKSSDKTFDNPGKEKESEDGEKTWSDITSTTDFILFWVSLVSTFIVTVTILGLLSSKY